MLGDTLNFECPATKAHNSIFYEIDHHHAHYQHDYQ